MRDIEFRIKDISGKWYYGMPLRPIKVDDKTCPFQIPNNEYYDLFANVNTLGQYTGLTDKNGTKIFEGDYIKMHYFFENYDRGTLGTFEDENEVEGVVVFDLNGFYVLYQDEIYPLSLMECSEEECKVIGNIYDNPELLAKTNNNNEEE